MAMIKFVTATGGLSTAESLLQVINQYPNGSTIKQLSINLNRPVSMINLALKTLISQKRVKVKVSDNRMQRLVFPEQLDKRSHLIELLNRL
jgi:hypothetical protein